MAVGNLAPNPESAVTIKDGKKACPAGHLDLEKQLRQMIFQAFALIDNIIYQMEGHSDASKTLTVHLTTSLFTGPMHSICWICKPWVIPLSFYRMTFSHITECPKHSSHSHRPKPASSSHMCSQSSHCVLWAQILQHFSYLAFTKSFRASFLSLVLDFELFERRVRIFIHLCNCTQS